MCILQIGELSSHLSEDFKAMYSDMPWQDIKRMRNIAAHRYGSFDVEVLWDTIVNDIPSLHDYCLEIIKLYIQKMEKLKWTIGKTTGSAPANVGKILL